MFDAREYFNALKPPTFIDADGTAHIGRILSHHEQAQNQVKLAEAAALGTDASVADAVAKVEQVFRDVLGSMFEAPVVEKIMALPAQGVQEALADFLGSQRRPTAATTTPETEPRVVGKIPAGGG